jgi:hypothetical protein
MVMAPTMLASQPHVYHLTVKLLCRCAILVSTFGLLAVVAAASSP